MKTTLPPLIIDSREPETIQYEFMNKAKDDPELFVLVRACETGDYVNPSMVLERKTMDDFVSSMTGKSIRKDGSVYERLESQIERILAHPASVKVLLIIGDIKSAFSRIHPNSVRGMIAKIISLGITVLWVMDGEDWVDLVIRLHKKVLKYCKERD